MTDFEFNEEICERLLRLPPKQPGVGYDPNRYEPTNVYDGQDWDWLREIECWSHPPRLSWWGRVKRKLRFRNA